MYVNAEFGNYPFPIRFCNRPEISVIKLFPEIKIPSRLLPWRYFLLLFFGPFN